MKVKPTPKRKNKYIVWLKIVIIIYCIVGTGLYFLQDKILFHPEQLPTDYKFQFHTPFIETIVPYDSSIRFNIIRFKADSNVAKKGAVIYFHGNMENINHYSGCVNNFTKHGYDLWMMDYPGFGKSTGTLTENILYIEALEVYKMVRSAGYPHDSIIIYGRSLGTGIAAQLASIRDCKRLILEAPYYSITDLAAHYFWMFPVDWITKYKIPTHEYLQKVTVPVVIFHGTKDNTIPFSNATELKAKCFKPGDELVPIIDGHHNDLNDFPLLKEKLDSLLRL